MIGATAIYIGPLVYISNREIIDAQVDHAQEALCEQVDHLKELASQRTNDATGLVKQRFGDYSNKATEYINHRRSASASPDVAKVPGPVKEQANTTQPAIKTEDFPVAPQADPVVPIAETKQETKPSEPLLA